MVNIEAVAAVVTIVVGVPTLVPAFRRFIIKTCSLSRNGILSLRNRYYEKKACRFYRYHLKNHEYYFRKLNELP